MTKDREPSKRDMLKEKIKKGIMDECTLIRQYRPWTYIEVAASYDSKVYIGMGFAKVKRPDEWEAKEGVIMALDKAIGHIARQVTRGYTIDEDTSMTLRVGKSIMDSSRDSDQ